MPVSTRHPSYEENYPRIELTEDAVEGCVRKEEYVPRLNEQSERAWHAYVNRAVFYNVTEKTLLALIGALCRKPHLVEGLVNDEPYVDEATFGEFLQRCYRTLLTQSRIGLHVDYDEAAGTPKLIAYPAENIINWCSDFIVIEEHVVERDPDDVFKHVSVPQWRELRINPEGRYEVRIWRKKGRRYEVIDEMVPTVRGAPLTEIPFWFVTPYDTSTEVYAPPLSNLAELNINHFRLSVDHAHGLHFTALPQPYIAGDIAGGSGDVNSATTKAMKLAIGTDRVWHLEQGATAEYLEFSGSGLGAIREQLVRVEEQMAMQGSRMLSVKKGVESVEALRLRSGSESATLSTIVGSLQHAMTAALTVYNQWAGSSIEPTITLNTDFTAAVIDPADMKALLDLWSAGAITLETFLTRLYDGEIVADVQEELAALGTSQPAVISGADQ